MTSLHEPGEAKTYNRTRLLTQLVSAVLSFVLLVVVLLAGLSRLLEVGVHAITLNPYLALILFAGALGITLGIVTLPLSFYSSFVIEHRYHLSNQSLARWAWERAKAFIVSLPIELGIIVFVWYCLVTAGDLWWIPVGTAMTLLSIVLARLAPVLIMPLFYKCTPLEDGELRDRILALCRSTGLRIQGVFAFDLSKNTRKANAAFTGLGRARRVILGDTLLREFTTDEVETVFAHELGHYHHRHLVAGMVFGAASVFAGLFIAATLYRWSAPLLGFAGTSDLAALPLLAIWLSIFGVIVSPIGNVISRRHERQADAYAVRTTEKKTAFIAALRKLASMNKADPVPHPVVEFLFYSHP